MADKQIKLDGRFIPMEEAIKAGLISEKDIDVPSKRLDRIDKMGIALANYEQMERDIEKIIEPYQLNWELDCLSLPSAIQSILERKEQECDELRGDLYFTNEQLKDFKSHYDKVVGECENLREKYLGLKEQKGSYIVQLNTVDEQLDQLKAENERLEAHSATLDAVIETGRVKYKALKQTLTEIKDIVGIGLVDGLQPEEYSGFLKILQAQILQKISEVEDENL